MLFVTTLLFLNLLPPIEVEELKGLIDNMVVIKITKGEKQINKGEIIVCLFILKVFAFKSLKKLDKSIDKV